MSQLSTNISDTGISAAAINRNYVHTAIPFSISFGILCSIGTFGNSFILYVYTTKYPVCNFRYFVIILGIIDLTRCLLTIPAEIYIQYTWFVGPISSICKTKIFLNTVSITYSTSILLLIAVDRFRKACRPHGWQIKPATSVKLCVILGIVSIVWSVPALIFCGPQSFVLTYAGENVSVTICLKDNTYKATVWPFLLLNAVYAGPTTIMMIVTLVLYGMIARAIFKRTKRKTGKVKSTPIVTENERSIELSLADVSDTANEESLVESEAYAALPGIGSANLKKNGVMSSRYSSSPIRNVLESPTNDEATVSTSTPVTTDTNSVGRVKPSRPTGSFYVKTGTSSSSSFLFNVPMIDINTLRDRSSNSTTISFTRPYNTMYSRKSRRRQRARMRRNTLIMFVLTLCFVVSILVYFILCIQLADTEKFFNKLTLLESILVMFFLRLYYFNILTNVVIFGLLDSRFRRALRRAKRRMSVSVASITALNNIRRSHNRR